jgi:hypothetical protein
MLMPHTFQPARGFGCGWRRHVTHFALETVRCPHNNFSLTLNYGMPQLLQQTRRLAQENTAHFTQEVFIFSQAFQYFGLAPRGRAQRGWQGSGQGFL